MENTNTGTNTTKRVEEYSLADFAKRVQENIKDGYELDLDTNENYPQQFGTLFTCGMIKTIVQSEKVITDEVVATEAVPVKRGRKPSVV